ncbi:MAG: exo-alpha-sialidase [Verrucomicrobiales bacterium]|nr:exo-alpha-sialidase [Verrucomicrobiales bacterium]
MKFLFSIFFCVSTAFAAEKPNIIFLMADDFGYGDAGCYGQVHFKTPNIDRLAKQGLRFTQAYSGGPVCTPARSSLMTGMHNGHSIARDNVPHYSTYLKKEDVTVAEVLKEAGYRTGGIGKWSLGDANTEGSAMNQGFDSWFGYLNQDHAHYYYPEYLDDDAGRLQLTGNSKTHSKYSHDLLTDRALKFIRESKDKPFFFYGAYALPHFSSKHEDKDGLTVPTTDPYSDYDWEIRSKKYASMVHMLDRDVGKIVDLVDELGLTNNTLIVFTSDNGGHSTVHPRFKTSGPLRGFKRSLTEGGIRVPFIARWPGQIPEGETCDQVIAFQDMMPTFAELAGATAPEGIDGDSVTDILAGGESLHKPLYWDYGHCRGKQYSQAARIRNWKGIRPVKTGAMELYDLSTDIGETKNIAADHPQVVAELTAFMDSAVSPDSRYQTGTIYKGGPVWKRLPPPPEDVAKAGDPGVIESGLIYSPDDAPTPQCHASTIVDTPTGLVAAWFGGTKERHDDVGIRVSRFVDGHWTKSVEVADGSEDEDRDYPCWNPVLFQPKDGPLLLFYKVGPSAAGWWGAMMSSDDGGITWRDRHKLGEGSLGPIAGPIKNKPIQLEDGAILCPTSTEFDNWRVHFEVTRDYGKTWQIIGPINDGTRFNAIQPSVLTHSDGRLQILCRTKESVVGQSWSKDGGKTWSEMTGTILPNPNSGTDAVTLKDGRQLLVYNHTVRRGPFPANRNMLNVAVSTDGEVWEPVLTLEREAKSEFSYPAVIQSADGKIHITYTWKRRSIKHTVLDPSAL